MPDGSPGFSLLDHHHAPSSAPGIQLGFGFTLIGVGGLLGLNRTMRLQPLMEGVRTGAIDSDPVPARRRRERAADHQRPAHVLPAAGGHVPDRPDGEARLGHADARQPLARRHHRDPGQHRDPRRARGRAARPRTRRCSCCRSTSPARSSSTSKRAVLLRRAVRLARPVHDARRRDGRCWSRAATTRTSSLSVGGFHPQFNAAAAAVPDARSGSRSSILNEPTRADPRRGYFAVTTNTVQFGAARRAVLRLQRRSASRATSPSTRCSSSRRSTSSSRSRHRSR